MDFLKYNSTVKELVAWIFLLLLILIYRKLRIVRWRKILKKSVEYHIFHLTSINRDSTINQTSRELAQSLLWGVSKQLPLDLAEGKGGTALWRSFRGDKTSLNTCGTVYYQYVMNFRTIDPVIAKLNDTLLSTLYRIYLLESPFSLITILYMDLTLLFYIILKTKTGTGRLILEMRGKNK